MKYLRGTISATYGAVALLLMLLLFPMGSPAQTFRGSISGYVADNSDAVVPNATVEVVSKGTGAVYKAVTTSAGQFQFQDMPLGQYQLTVTATGFAVTKLDNIPVSAGVVYNVPVKLSVGEQADTISVQADQLVLDTASTALTTVMSTETVQDMPRNGRDYTQNILLIPGSNVAGGSGITSINGGRVNSVNWQMDGTDDNDLWYAMPASNESGVSAIAGTLIPLDAIDQFSFGSNANSDSGHSASGTANVIIKSGTNTFHGSAYFFDRNEALAAKSPFLTSKNKIRDENTGMSLGGPIWKDKLFFFLSFEHQGFLIGNQTSSTEPSAAYQAAATNVLNYYGMKVNPLSTTLLANLWPADALTGPATLLNYFNRAASTGYSNNGVIKIDSSLTDKDHLSAKWFYGQGPQRQPNGTYLLPYYEVSGTWVQNYSLIYDRVINSKMTNQASAGVSYIQEAFKDYQSNYNPVALGLNTGVTNPSLSGAPKISIGPSGSAFDPTGPEPLSGRNSTTGQLNEILSYSAGAHQIRVGGEFRHSILNEFYQTGQRGTFSFDGTQGPWGSATSSACAQQATQHPTQPLTNLGANPQTVLALADYMAGCVSTSTIVQGDRTRQIFVNGFSLFAQDSWQVNHNLNLNLGLRYEYTSPPHNDNKDLTVFDPDAPNGISVAGQDNTYIYPAFWKGISPHIGFSWQPQQNGKTVLRGGFGFYYDALWLNPFLNLSAKNNGPFGIQDNPAGNSIVAQSSVSNYVWQTGQPIFPTLQQAIDAQTGVINLFSVSKGFQPGVNYNFNLNIQQDMGKMGIAQIGYVGTQGRHLLDLIDINQAAPSISGKVNAATRPYYSRFPDYGVINQLQSGATSNYNSLQVTWRFQNWKGLTGQLSYTWAHALDVETGLNPYLPQDSFNLKGNYGNSDFDIRNSFTGFLTYMVPSLQTTETWKKSLANGWQVNGLMTFRGGEPFTVVANSNVSGNGEFSDRANLVGDPFAGLTHKIVNGSVTWYNSAAFANPAPGTYGTLRRNQFHSPGYSDVDLSVFKTTAITKRISLQLRAEMFNLFNYVNLAQVGQSASVNGSPIKSTLGSAYGAPGIGLGEPFNMQLAAKVIF